MIPNRTETRGLARRFQWSVVAIGLPIIAILILLIYREYGAGRERTFALHRTRATTTEVTVEGLIQATDIYVAGLRDTAEAALTSPLPLLQGPDWRFDPNSDAPVDLSGRVANLEPRNRALLVGIPRSLAVRPASRRELKAAMDLGPVEAAAHSTRDYYRWSYFFSASKDIVALYPHVGLYDLLDRKTPRETMAAFFTYDVYRLTERDRNPDRGAIWVPVYFDAGGAGLMVSHSAPVDVAGRQVGMVGTDILLKEAARLLVVPSGSSVRLALVDQAGNLIGDSDNRTLASSTIIGAGEMFGFILEDLPERQFVARGDDYVFVASLAGAPWRLVYRVPVAEVDTAAIRAVVPYLLYLALLSAAMLASYLIVATRFVQPAFKLLTTLETMARGAPVPDARVPSYWRPWFDRIVSIFVSQRESLKSEREARSKAGAVIDVALDGVVTADATGHIVDFSPAAEKMFGRQRGDVLGKRIGDILVPGHLRAAHEAGIERKRTRGTARVLGRRVELEALHASGESFPIELQIHEIDHVEGLRYVAYIRNLTDQKAAEAELERHREKLHQAEKLSAMGSLLAGLAHELNNPLAIVIAQSTLLEELSRDKQTHSRVAKIKNAADRCGRIVKTFLTMARQQTPERVPVLLADILDNALDMLGYSLKSAGVTVERHDADDAVAVIADPDQINQVVVNLIVNAQQAFGDTEGERLVRIETAADDGMATITVADNGPGIPDALKERIFEAFFTTKPVGVGTGIGLAVTANIVKAHGGAITVADRAGGGTVFCVRLPLAPHGAQRNNAEAIAASAPTPRSGHTFLIVDDEAEVAEALSDFLYLEGHDARIETSIRAGLAALEDGTFTGIFCDLRMPGGGGGAFWHALGERWPQLADGLVFVTGDLVAGPTLITSFAAGRSVPILEKPFERDDVRTAVEALLAARGPATP